MAVTFEPFLISTPTYPDPLTPPDTPQWLATECPNLFRLQRMDYAVTLSANNGGFLEITITPSITAVVPVVGDKVALYDDNNDEMLLGMLTDVTAYPGLITSIVYVAGMNITYMNDNTIHDGYYFEGQLYMNGKTAPEALTIIASPDSFGFADLDVSGILRIMTSLGKTSDLIIPPTTVARIVTEPTKSGKFILNYRGRWYCDPGDIDDYTPEGNDWYYAEVVRSAEQGSNLHEYVVVPVVNPDVPFLNSFDRPVYFLGLPFDLSFILPVLSPPTDLVVTIRSYNSNNIELGSLSPINVPINALGGYVDSLNIDLTAIEASASYLTVEITI